MLFDLTKKARGLRAFAVELDLGDEAWAHAAPHGLAPSAQPPLNLR